MTRTRSQVRDERLTVMSAALDQFRLRRANLGRRSVVEARHMRWAGEEAKYCIASTKAARAYDAAKRKIADDIAAINAERLSRMSPEQRENRARYILSEIEALVYAPWGVNIASRRGELERELAFLQPAPVAEPTATTPAKAITLVATLLAVS